MRLRWIPYEGEKITTIHIGMDGLWVRKKEKKELDKALKEIVMNLFITRRII